MMTKICLALSALCLLAAPLMSVADYPFELAAMLRHQPEKQDKQ